MGAIYTLEMVKGNMIQKLKVYDKNILATEIYTIKYTLRSLLYHFNCSQVANNIQLQKNGR